MNEIHKFKLSNYPIFALLISYQWFEIANPWIGFFLQIIPRVPNGLVAIILAWIIIPKQLQNIPLPKNKIAFILPFLIIILIKIPFVEVAQMNTVIAVASDWLSFLFYYPMYIKLLTTRSGRENFFLSISFSAITGCIIYIIALGGVNLFNNISSNSLSQVACIWLPVAARGALFRSGSIKYINILALILIFFSVIFAGGRSMLLVSMVQISFFAFYFLSFQKLIKQATLIAFLLFSFSLFINVEQGQIDFRNKKFSRIMNWKEDGSIWLRVALYSKARDIFLNNFLLGAGWGAKTLGFQEGKEIDIENFRAVNTSRKGLHSTPLRIISGTGLLGVVAFLFFFIKNLRYFFEIKFRFIKKDSHFVVFLSIAIGLIINSFQNTTDLYIFFLISSFILSTHIYLEHLMKLFKIYMSRNWIKS